MNGSPRHTRVKLSPSRLVGKMNIYRIAGRADKTRSCNRHNSVQFVGSELVELRVCGSSASMLSMNWWFPFSEVVALGIGIGSIVAVKPPSFQRHFRSRSCVR